MGIQIMTSWTRKVRSLIDIKGPPWIKCLEVREALGPLDEQDAALSTIVSFHCYCNRETPGSAPDTMTMDELRHLQFCMTSDLSQWQTDLHLCKPASSRFFIGQPVDLCSDPSLRCNVLRVAASAPLVLRMWNEGEEIVAQEDEALFEKLTFILANWLQFKGQP